jgi:hypothetical protein
MLGPVKEISAHVAFVRVFYLLLSGGLQKYNGERFTR